jgi:hypothetical protein
MSQTGAPYRDANVDISSTWNGSTVSDYLFVDGSGAFYMYFTASETLTINCPIFDQWDTRGYYDLLIQKYNGYTGVYTTVEHTHIPKDAMNTPDAAAISTTVNMSFDPDSFEYFVTLTAS